MNKKQPSIFLDSKDNKIYVTREPVPNPVYNEPMWHDGFEVENGYEMYQAEKDQWREDVRGYENQIQHLKDTAVPVENKGAALWIIRTGARYIDLDQNQDPKPDVFYELPQGYDVRFNDQCGVCGAVDEDGEEADCQRSKDCARWTEPDKITATIIPVDQNKEEKAADGWHDLYIEWLSTDNYFGEFIEFLKATYEPPTQKKA